MTEQTKAYFQRMYEEACRFHQAQDERKKEKAHRRLGGEKAEEEH